MKTLAEIAAQAGVNKSTVFRFVKSAGIQPCNAATMRTDRVQRYDATAEQAIMQHFATRCNDAETVRNDASATPEIPCNDALQRQIDDLRQQLDQANTDRAFLREQLEHLRTDHADQLRQMQSIIDRLTDQLDQERQHSREQSDRLAQLADQAQRLQLAAMNSRPLDQITDQQTQEKPLTFWQRLFKRK